MADEFKVLLGAELSKNIDIQSEINKVKGLHLNIDSIRINKDVINTINAEISKTGTKLNLDLNIDTNSAVRQAQTATQQVQQIISGAVQRTKFDQIFKPTNLNDAAKEAEKYFRTISKTVSVQEQLGDDKGLQSFIVSLKNADGLVEQLRYSLKSITDDTGKVTDKYFEYAGGSINDKGIIQQFTKISAKADDLSLKLEKVKTAYSDMNAPKAIKNTEHVSALSAQYEKVTTAINAVRSADDAVFTSMVSNVNREIAVLENLVTQYKNAEYAATSLRTKDIRTIQTDEGNNLDAFVAKMERSGHYVDDLKYTVSELKTQLSQVFDSASLTEYLNKLSNLQTKFKAVDAEAKNHEKGMRSLAQSQSLVFEKERVKSNLERILSQNTAMTKGLREQFQMLLADIDRVDAAGLTNIKKQISTLSNDMKSAGKYGPGFVDKIKENVSAFTNWFVIGGLVSGSVRSVKQMVSSVYELDTELIDLRKTTDATSAQLEDFYHISNNVAKQLGVATREVISQTSEWSRLGYAISDAQTMSENSAIFKSISPRMDIEMATNGLVSTMKAFEISADDTLDGIISKINIIGNTQAVDNQDLVEILTRSSSAMAEANNTLEQTIALGTAATEITRDAASVGNALKTISMRIRGYDEETESYSEDLENLSGTIADLTKTASTPGGISLFSDAEKSTYKSTYQLLEDISRIYNQLSDKNQADLLEALAGKRQGQVVASMISNFGAAEKSMNSMANSAGNALEEMEVIYDSLSYKINRLSETGTGIAQNLFAREDMAAVVDTLTTLGETIDFITEKLGLFGTIGIGTGAFALIKNLGWLTLTRLERQDIKIA